MMRENRIFCFENSLFGITICVKIYDHVTRKKHKQKKKLIHSNFYYRRNPFMNYCDSIFFT